MNKEINQSPDWSGIEEAAQAFEHSWLRGKKSWVRLCGKVDAVIQGYAQKLGGTVSQWLHDTPSRVVVWRRPPLGYSISMLLEDGEHPVLKIWGAGWLDDERRGRRRVLPLGPMTVNTPVQSSSLDDALGALVGKLASLDPILTTLDHSTGRDDSELIGDEQFGEVQEVRLPTAPPAWNPSLIR